MRKIEFLNGNNEKEIGIFLQWISDPFNEDGRSNSIYALIESTDGRVEFSHMYDVQFIHPIESE